MRFSNSRGDTLIEVTIALTILSVVLVTIFGLSIKAYQLGQTAGEHTQADNLIQEQAEALRSLRDTSATWGTFKSLFGSGPVPSGFFQLQPSGGSWVVSACTSDPQIDHTQCLSSGFYNLFIKANTTNPDLVQFDITARWDAFGGGPENKVNVTTYLANLDGLRLRDCSVAGACP